MQSKSFFEITKDVLEMPNKQHIVKEGLYKLQENQKVSMR